MSNPHVLVALEMEIKAWEEVAMGNLRHAKAWKALVEKELALARMWTLRQLLKQPHETNLQFQASLN